ncbi:MAG: isoamylase early set domain-containing protein, partial [Longimicrobiales bacterium]
LTAMVLLALADGAPERAPVVTAPAASGDVYVQFMLEARDVRSVALAGDFTTWTPAVELQDPDGDGVWSGRVRLEPGVHQYMFVIDGTRWVTDPNAGRYVDDGFGNRNAVVVIPPVSS